MGTHPGIHGTEKYNKLTRVLFFTDKYITGHRSCLSVLFIIVKLITPSSPRLAGVIKSPRVTIVRPGLGGTLSTE